MSAIPQLDLQRQYNTLKPDLDAAIARVMASQRFILGPEVETFEKNFAAAVGVAHAVGVSSCSDALLATLMALDIGPGDEVITTSYTFIATVEAICRVGAKPVLVDIDPKTFQFDLQQVARAITTQTRAIIAVHLFGRCVAMDALRDIAENIPIIEDVAQAQGAIYRNAQAGSMGLFGCFSFFPSKNLGGCGDGGMITTSDNHLAQKLRSIRNHGLSGQKFEHAIVGGNFRLDALHAAILGVKLPHLPTWIAARRRHAAHYHQRFAAASAVQRPPYDDANGSDIMSDTFNQYVIRVQNRDAVKNKLTATGIGTTVYYPMALHQQKVLAPLGYTRGAFPNAEKAALDNLALPIFPELTYEEVDSVATAVLSAV